MPKPSDFERILIARGAAARLYELKLEQKRLEDILKKYGRGGSAKLAGPRDDGSEIAHETSARTQRIYAGARAEARQQKRQSRKKARRRSMSPEARKAVSERMKRYWAKKRKEQQ